MTPAGEQRAHKGETEISTTMCEIAVVPNPVEPHDEDTEAFEQSVRALIGTCRTLYNENPDGLGVVAVYDDGDSFDYALFKAVDPEFGPETDLYDFFAANDSAWRFAIHARLKTHGGIGYAQTHPIMVGGCPQIDGINYVMHNGVITADSAARRSLESEGHQFNTHVDSEVIPHAFESLPTHDELNSDEFDEPDAISGRANFILFGDEGILMRMERKYDTTTDFTVLCNRRSEASIDPDHEYSRTHYGLITPGGENSFRQAPRKSIYAGNAQRKTAGWFGHAGFHRGSARQKSNQNYSQSRGSKSGVNGSTVRKGDSGKSYRRRRSRETDDKDERDYRKQTQNHFKGGNSASADDSSPTTVTVEPDSPSTSEWCEDHGWYDEPIEGRCPSCAHKQAQFGGAGVSLEYADEVDYCAQHRTYHNGSCPECVDDSLGDDAEWPTSFQG